MRELPRGSSKVAYSKNGNLSVPSCGSMENVRSCYLPLINVDQLLNPDARLICVVGSGKSILWFVISQLPSPTVETHID